MTGVSSSMSRAIFRKSAPEDREVIRGSTAKVVAARVDRRPARRNDECIVFFVFAVEVWFELI